MDRRAAELDRPWRRLRGLAAKGSAAPCDALPEANLQPGKLPQRKLERTMSAFLRTALVLGLVTSGVAACSNQVDTSSDHSTGSAMGSSTIGSGSNTNGIGSIEEQYQDAHQAQP
jgi:hypothetical protein